MEFKTLSVVLKNIPKIETKQDTFFDILGIQSRETYISKVYDYFLNSNNKEIANLFLNSLVNLIKLKAEKELLFDDFSCYTEVLTDKGGRIDLLIESKEEDKSRKIIIENKVFHFLANDLQDYWDSTKADEKVGVLLTLTPQDISETFEGKFVNITHHEWMNELKNIGLPLNLRLQEYTYINDFYINLNKLMESQKFSEELEFFHTNAKQISEAVNLLDKFLGFIKSNISSVANELDYKAQHKKHHFSYIYKNDEDKVFYTIFYDKIVKGESSITIVIELWTKEITGLAKEIDKKFFKNELEEKDFRRYTKNRGSVNEDWLHFTAKDYTLTKDNLKNLSTFIGNNIKEDFADIMGRVQDYVSELKSQKPPLLF